MSVAPPSVKRELELDGGGGGGEQSPGARLKRRKQAAPTRAPPPHPPLQPTQPPQPLADLHAKMADIYKSALALGELSLPPFDPLAAYRLLPRVHDPPRIFNPEAYCDLCCKEFCNKYFLKTHRANKHGIYDSSGDERVPQSSCSPPMPQQQQQQQQQRRRASDEESAGAPRRLSPDSCRRARDASFQPDVLRRLGVINPEAFCEICCKEYCNKYFLKTHRERRHGAPPPTPPPELTPPRAPSPPRSTTPPPPTLVKREREEEDEVISRDGQTSPLNLIVEERGMADISPGSASEELRKLQTMISQLNELTAERLVDSEQENGSIGPGVNIGGIPRDSRPPSSSPPPPDERRSSSGSSFCEICNKELCNKYFMRTHMQRMHGISLEGGAQLGGVTCDICHKELCSKYFLRVHKHNTHGIPAPPAPPAAPEPCPLCARRFRGPRALRAHLLAEHAPPARPPAPLPPLPPLSSDAPLELLTRDKPYACTYCPFTTDVLAFLFAHERAHAQAAEVSEPEGSASGLGEEESNGGGIGIGLGRSSTLNAAEDGYSCSRCEFRSNEFSAMEAHLRAAHGGSGALMAVPRSGSGGAVPVTMQPFVLEEAAGGLSLVPALVFLPVRRRATRRATVTFTLTPA